VRLGVLSFFIAFIAASTAAFGTGIGRPLVRLGLLIGSPVPCNLPSDSNLIATAVAWSFAIPNLDIN
jgi:hypothetical protein